MKTKLLGELNLMKTLDIKPNFSALEKKYGINRHTISKMWKEGGVKPMKRNKTSYLEKHRSEIEEKINENECTKKALFMYFRNKYGKDEFRNYSTFVHFVNDNHLKKPRENAPHIRFETEPGKQLQVDWKEDIQFELSSGEIIEFNLFAATFGYSRFHIFIYSKTKMMEDFLRCLIECYYKFGLPEEVLTDNMTAIVSIRMNKKKKHNTILCFEKDTGVKIKLCKTRSPETKGKVESSNRFIQWITPYQKELDTEEQLISLIEQLNKDINNEVNRTTNIPPVVLMKKEKEHLKPIPNNLLLESYICEVDTETVPPTLLVPFKGKGYSVPPKFIGKKVKLIPSADKLYIYCNTQLITVHTIGNRMFNYDKEHYKKALSISCSNKNDEEIEQMAIRNLKIFENME